MRVFPWVALLFWIGLMPVVAQQVEQPIKTTLCEIKKDPMAFNKKLVEVSGYASHGFEDSMFEDPTCFWGRGLPGIWMEYGGTATTHTMYCCGVDPNKEKKPLIVQGVSVSLVRDDLFTRFDDLLHSGSEKGTSVRATARGRIFTASESVNGRTRFAGYGHMGCCMLFAIERVLSVESEKPGPSIFDLAHDYESKSK